MENRKKECFRNEWKYLISTSEKELLKLRMKHFLKLDPHAGTGSYMIRSLYFDDYWNSAFEEKEAGVLMRKKYRIRIYDCSERSITHEIYVAVNAREVPHVLTFEIRAVAPAVDDG